MRLVLFFLLVLSVLCMSQTIEQKCIEKPIYELSENGKGKIVGSIEVKEQGKGIAIHVVASGLKPGPVSFISLSVTGLTCAGTSSLVFST